LSSEKISFKVGPIASAIRWFTAVKFDALQEGRIATNENSK
jgi:hypothetical protein